MLNIFICADMCVSISFHQWNAFPMKHVFSAHAYEAVIAKVRFSILKCHEFEPSWVQKDSSEGNQLKCREFELSGN